MVMPANLKKLRLRYAGTCRDCGTDLARGITAWHDPSAKQVLCLACADGPTGQPAASLGDAIAVDAPADPDEREAEPETLTAISSGAAGASARREYERRVAKREARIRERHPKLGGLIVAFSDDPQNTAAWARGATGEELLGKQIDRLTDRGVRVLHDRRIPRTRANIDHIAISASGVFVLDAKRYRGRPHLRVEGGILRPRAETLMVGSRKCNSLVDGVTKQVRLVTDALAAADGTVPVTGMLVFVDADWPLFGGGFTTQGAKVLWPEKAMEHILEPGAHAYRAAELKRTLAAAFPPA